MDDECIFTHAGIEMVAVIDLLHGRLTSSDDAKKLLDYAKLNNCNFLDFEDVELIGTDFIEELININHDIILVGADHLIPEKYHDNVNLLDQRK